MFIDSEKKILNFIQFVPPIFVIISSLLIVILLYFEHKTNLNNEIKNIKNDFLISKKKEIKTQVVMVEKFIVNSKRELSLKLEKEELQREIINQIKKFEYQKDRYIFIVDYDSNVLVHPNKDILNKNIFKSAKSQKIKDEIRDIVNVAKEGRGYLTYTQFVKPSTNELVDKTSYVIGFNDWRWFIGTGFYHDDVNKSIEIKKENLEVYYNQQLIQSIKITIIFVILILVLSYYFSKVVKRRFSTYKKEIEKSIEEKEEYTKVLYQQSKLASIGEMIGNIAHQWRQPLTVISMSANNMKMDIELDEVRIDSLNRDINEIVSQTDYLSNTIDDFRNFFRQSNESTVFELKSAIEKTLKLVKLQFKKHNINIIVDSQDIKVHGIYNEFIQVLINVLNNSKDAFELNGCNYDKYIFIKVLKNDKVRLDILDNAGGVEDSVLIKAFEPYVTTKHQSQGTGIGLYMSSEIIDKHMNGQITIKNVEYSYESSDYKGAQVSIVLPLYE